MITPTHKQALVVRYLGPTNTLGARIRVTHPALGTSKTIPYDHRFRSAEEGALHWLHEHGVSPNSRHDLCKGQSALVFPCSENAALFMLFRRNQQTNK